MHPARKAQEALEVVEKKSGKWYLESVGGTALAQAYALLAVADGLEHIAVAIEDLKKDFVTVEVMQ